MIRKRLTLVLGLLIIASMVLAACQPAPTATPAPTQPPAQPQPTTPPDQPQPTPEPTPVPRTTRVGPWLDAVIVVEEPSSEAAVTRLNAGELDVYAYTIGSADIFKTVQGSPGLTYSQSVGSYNELSFNPAGPVFEGTGKLNPFAVAKVREAMNYLVDRSFITQEIMGGLGVEKFFPISTAFADYAAFADVARKLETQYAYNPERAREIITTEMEALGATLVGGKWQYEGEPVELIFLIRVEDERREIGDYVSNQLEDLGFTVRRDYKTSAEASPIWLRGNPSDGLFHVYTGGWITTAISRDQGGNFDFFYTPRGLPRPLWQAYVNAADYDTVADRLARNDFKTLDERRDLFAQALELSMQDSVRVWLADRLSFTPRKSNVVVTADLAGAVAGARLWPFTLRYDGVEGGQMTVAMPSILTEAWNPIAGSNWIYDMALIRATGDNGVYPDPYTGLAWPHRIERAEVFVQEGLPVGKTLDWVTLEFVPEISVPTDAWVDWDAENQVFVTAGEKFPEGLTALNKSVVYYPADLYDAVKWHDGSAFDAADIVMRFIQLFDRGKPESANYDEATVPALNSFLASFKGMKIVSESPLTIEWYTDNFALDAELSITTLWPEFPQGTAGWHSLSVGILADGAGELAFSASKAQALEIDVMNYIGGPSLEVLKKYLDQAIAENYIPFAPTLGSFITADEAKARWENYRKWFQIQGHFWLGTGPFYLDKAFPVEGTVTLRRNAAYPDLADRWARFGEPRLADVEVDGPGRVSIGSEAAFDVFVTFKGEPYASADITEVKFLVFDAKGALAFSGNAEMVAEGQYSVVLPADVTSKLEAGSNKLEVVVVPFVVSIPSFESFEFVTAP